MKTLIITMISISLLPVMGYAQETPSNKTSEKQAVADALAKEAVESKPILFGTVTTNKPYSAEAVSESIQTLFDGNRITRKTSVKMFRDSKGRTRREGNGIANNLSSSALINFPNAFSSIGSNSISINDPVDKVRYKLNTNTKTARRYDNQRSFGSVTKITSAKSALPKRVKSKSLKDMSPKERAELVARLKKENPNSDKIYKLAVKNLSNVVIMGSPTSLSYKSAKSESLGTRIYEGVEAEGTRTVKTIEAGAIGNDLPIEITYERWYSKELNLVVYSRKYDPRSGEQIYRLTNIDQTEPDSSLFTVPSDYKIVDTKRIKLKK